MKISPKQTAQDLLLLIISSFALALVGCGNSADGPMLSDDEKLKKASQGREAYSSGVRDGGSKTQPTTGGSK